MILSANPAKVLRLFAPLWVLLAASLWLNWSAWQPQLVLLAVIASLPLAAALATAILRDHWRLELTADALLHHALARSERFEWSRMGLIQLRAAPFLDRLLVRTFWFAFPTDTPRTLNERASQIAGRRILCVFGDHNARDTIEEIEAWRALHATAPLPDTHVG